MFVMGIDPGLSRCGYGLVAASGDAASPGALRAVAAGVLETDPEAPLPQRLRLLRDELGTLMTEHRPDAVAVERVFFQVNARTAMSVGQASGLALAEAAAAGCEIAQYTSNEVKQALAGWGAADKEQVRRMVAAILGVASVPGPPDVADALALALCHIFGAPVRRAVEVAAAQVPR
ncbi:MAG TPA: crossover junction endodeoxyribonuclease RuvC [Acidimicrobiales bacterium]|nr:crossover junction endodeoxyribonuclease RuvC [Acidimicrobiales bacterium]